jgi:hypothetical protein
VGERKDYSEKWQLDKWLKVETPTLLLTPKYISEGAKIFM